MAELSTQRLWGWLHKVGSDCVDLLFPPVCIACGRAGALFCSTCAQAVEPVGPAICLQCGKPQAQRVAQCAVCQTAFDPPLRLIRAATLHREPLRQAIHHLKYENSPAMAVPLARYLIATFAQPPWSTIAPSLDGVAPVPLHAQRLAERGYNQSELLATAFCRQIRLPLHTDWLQRQRETRSQVTLNRIERRQNVEDAFTAHSSVRNKTILLIDDVYTTGATLDACATALLIAGASAVYALALAAPMHVN